MDTQIRALALSDVAAVATIYREASTARTRDEIGDALVLDMVRNAIETGVALAASEGDRVVGFVLGPRNPLRRLSHVMGHLLICVEPGARGRGIGRRLMTDLLSAARTTDWCERVELFVRSENARAITLYTSLGFVVEGRLRARVATAQGRQDDLVMGWLVPRGAPL